MGKVREIGRELLHHAPFTFSGALLGLLFMYLFRNFTSAGGQVLFSIFHPAHVVLSAMVTSALYKLHRPASSFLTILLIGYFGSIGVATLSDCVLPYIGENLLGLDIPSHEQVHHHSHTAQDRQSESAEAEHETHAEQPAPDRPQVEHHIELHLGFIEEWYIVNPAALAGILLAFFLPRTRLPHAGHILISTWASAAHILMNIGFHPGASAVAGMLAVLFVSVWVPCCVSDIVFPLLFVRPGVEFCEVCKCKH